MTTFLRHRQVGITRVSPHADNKRYAIPGGLRGRGPGYPDDASYYNGTDSYIRRTTPLTDGTSTSKQAIISIWFRIAGGAGTDRYMLENNFRSSVRISDTDTLLMRVTNSSGSNIGTMAWSGMEGLIDGRFHHVIAAWDLADLTLKGYLDDVDNGTASGMSDQTIDFSTAPFRIAVGLSDQDSWYGCLGEIYVNIAEYIDLDDIDERRKFIDSDGKPVELGANGELPTGTPPSIYLKNGGRDGLNQGTGGDFDQVIGSPVKCTIPGPQV